MSCDDPTEEEERILELALGKCRVRRGLASRVFFYFLPPFLTAISFVLIMIIPRGSISKSYGWEIFAKTILSLIASIIIDWSFLYIRERLYVIERKGE